MTRCADGSARALETGFGTFEGHMRRYHRLASGCGLVQNAPILLEDRASIPPI